MKRLRLGINLIFLGSQAGGVGRYAVELMRALLSSNRAPEIHAFVGRHAPEEVLEADWSSDVRWVRLPVTLDGPPTHLAAQFAAIPSVALWRHLDVIHSPANVGPVMVPRIPCVVTLHDLLWMHMGEAWGTREAIRSAERLILRCARRADRVITVSASVAADLEKIAGFERATIDVVPNGVSTPPAKRQTSETYLRQRLGLEREPIILCAAQKRPYKNLSSLIRAVADLRDVGAALVLPGSPTQHEADLKDLARRLGVTERVRFLGWVSEEDLEGLYAMATGFMLPSLMEGFGLPVLEAMVRGVPVACSGGGALAEVAGEAALTFNPEDQQQVTDAMARLLTDAALQQELAAKGRARAASFSWGATAEATIDSYHRAMAQRRSRMSFRRASHAKRRAGG